MNNLLKLIGITCISLHCNAEQIVPVHWYSEEIEHCGSKLTKHIYKLNNSDKLSEKTTFKETEDTFKRKDLILKPLCTIGNPAISDGIRYTIISFSKKNEFLVVAWNGFDGRISKYGPFLSLSYDNEINRTNNEK